MHRCLRDSGTELKYCHGGDLPSKQTVEGFFSGESVPVNQKLSDIFLQLQISERSGRGVPKKTELYGEDCIELRENSIVVTILFERLETKVDVSVGNGNVPDRTEIPSVGTEIPLVETIIPPDRSENPLLKELGIEERILRFCAEAKNIQEIMEYLGYRDKKTVRKYLSSFLMASQDRCPGRFLYSYSFVSSAKLKTIKYLIFTI